MGNKWEGAPKLGESIKVCASDNSKCKTEWNLSKQQQQQQQQQQQLGTND
jgi:hypothetical protein